MRNLFTAGLLVLCLSQGLNAAPRLVGKPVFKGALHRKGHFVVRTMRMVLSGRDLEVRRYVHFDLLQTEYTFRSFSNSRNANHVQLFDANGKKLFYDYLKEVTLHIWLPKKLYNSPIRHQLDAAAGMAAVGPPPKQAVDYFAMNIRFNKGVKFVVAKDKLSVMLDLRKPGNQHLFESMECSR